MSTTSQPLKYLWSAYFEDGHIINQPKNDHYSKHDNTAEWNPSAFRDIIEYPSPVVYLELSSYHLHENGTTYGVDLILGTFSTEGEEFSLETEPLLDRKLIYYREMQQDSIDGCTGEPYVVRYALGYEGKNSHNKIEKKVIFIRG